MNAKSSKAADLKEKEELKRIVLHYEEQERRGNYSGLNFNGYRIKWSPIIYQRTICAITRVEGTRTQRSLSS